MRKPSVVYALALKAILLAASLSTSALSQAPPDSPAAKSLEAYRQSKESILHDDFGELSRYRAANAGLKPPAPGEKRVVFFGDSITDIWPIAKYFPGKPYVNRGIGGQTTRQMLIRFRADVINLQPAAVVILAGTNDIAGNTGPMTLDEIEGNYASLAELARAHNIRVIFSSVLPISNYAPKYEFLFIQRSPEKILGLNRWLQDYCASSDCLYLDYFSAMADPKGLLKKELADDGLHPNADGYAIMAPLAEAAIQKALGVPVSAP